MADEQSIRETILSASDKNSILLVKLAQTSEAPSILSAHVAHLTYLKDTLTEQETSLKQLTETVDTKYKTHRKYRDGTARKLYYKATRMFAKFESRANMSEQEYFTALGSKSKAEERCETLKRDVEGATKAQEALDQAAKEHEDTHHQIDELYEGIFAGPTPGFPREDERENQFYVARGKNEEVKADIIKARRATRLLTLSTNNLKRAATLIKRARKEAEKSLVFFDQATYWLGLANEYVGYVLSNVGKVEDIVKPLDGDTAEKKRQMVTALQGAKVETRVLFSSDKVFAAVQAMQDALEESQPKLNEMIETMKQKEKDGLEFIKMTARTMEDSRQALQEIRQGIFEEVAGFGEAAPSYMECCDRADGFCRLPDYPHDEGAGPSEEDEEEHEQNDGGESSAGPAVQQSDETPVMRKVFTSKDLGLLA